MEKFNIKQIILRNTLAGLIIGSLFVMLLMIFEYYTKAFAENFTQLFEEYGSNPIFLAILSLPLLLAIVGYIIGKKIANSSRTSFEEAQYRIQQYKKLSNFVQKLKDGDIEAEYLVDEGDEIGQSLIELRNNLKKNIEEEEVRKKEDAERRWVTEGVAKFGGILQQHSDDLEDLSSNIISNLVKYMEAEQAGFFVLNDRKKDRKYFEMMACFAYSRHKYADKRVEWGEGLIGACALEKETIFMTNVTENYVEITSGLGQANPRSVLIVPLKVNEIVHGVIELASFKVYEKFEIEFVEKIGESIASAISSVKISLQTNSLLKESQEQARKMAEQEDILRQNMDELKDTQREAAKQAEEFISFTNSVNHTLIRAEYDIKGILLYSNSKFIEKLEYNESSEVIGHHISMFINEKDKVWFNKIWEGLAGGGRHFEGDMKHVTKYGNDLWTMATYVCVRNNEGGVEKILFLGTDITENKKQSLDYEGKINALNRSSIKADFYPNGKIIECNEKFMAALDYSMPELRQKRVFDFIAEEDINSFELIWDNVINRIPFDGRIKFFSKENEEKWFHGTYTAVDNMYDEVAKIVFIANEITEQIRSENKIKEQTERLKIQERKLQQSQVELSQKLKETREEMKNQFREIETVKVLNEKTLEGTLDAILTINQEGYLEFFNRAAEELWGYTKKEVLGQNVSIILPPDAAENEENYLGNVFKYSENLMLRTRTEMFIVDKENNKIPVLVTLAEARMGKEYRLTAFIQNIEVELF